MYRVFVSGVGSLSGFRALQAPTRIWRLYVSLFFSFVWLVSSTPCFLVSSVSLRRWGNPNLLGLGFPLCLFDLDAIAHFDPYSDLRTYTMATPHTCFFFFFFRRRRRSFSGSSVSRFVLVVLCFFSVCFSRGGSLHANFKISPFSKGEMLSVFSFCVFCVWSGVFCRFFYRSSLLRVVI